MVIVIPRSEEQKKNVINAAYEDMVTALKKLKREDLIQKCEYGRNQLINCKDKFIFEMGLDQFYKMSFYFQDQLDKNGKSKSPKIKRAKKTKKGTNNSNYKSNQDESGKSNLADHGGIIEILNKPLKSERAKKGQDYQPGYAKLDSQTPLPGKSDGNSFLSRLYIDPDILSQEKEKLKQNELLFRLLMGDREILNELTDICKVMLDKNTKNFKNLEIEAEKAVRNIDDINEVKKEVETLYNVYKDGFGLAYFAYGLSKSEIRPKIENLIPALSKKYNFKDPEFKWRKEDSQMSFSFKAKGQKISGETYLFNQALFIGGKLPFLAKLYGAQIEDTIYSELDLIFKDQK